MTDTARLVCAIVGSVILHLSLRASRTGKFETMQGTLSRSKRPRVFVALLVFWFAAAIFLFSAAVGAFSHLGSHHP